MYLIANYAQLNFEIQHNSLNGNKLIFIFKICSILHHSQFL